MLIKVICGVVLVLFIAMTVSRGCLQDRTFFNFCQKREMPCLNHTDCCDGLCRPSPIPPYSTKCF